MRAKTNWQAGVPNDACEETQYGETEDYSANIGALGVLDMEITNSELIITSQDNNQFEVTLNTEYDGKVYVAIKPLNSDYLSDVEKTQVRTNLNKLNMKSIIIVFQLNGV